ncbi:cysteine proteinase [Backusella circina FSU 941]|nr:cysteine proteinase [Backusella circina FSU 941]
MTKNFFKKHNKNGHNHHKNGVNHQESQSHHHRQQKKVVKNTIRTFPKEKLKLNWKVNRSIGPGLVNAGNTCFLNSVLQCLTYSPAFTQYLFNTKHSDKCPIVGFCALCSMRDHVMNSFVSGKSFKKHAALLPRAFTSNLRKISKLLTLGQQEDAHEFLTFLLQAFQKSLTFDIEKVTPQLEESTAISQIFGGKIRSQITCRSCKEKINNYEAFLDLSLDLNRADSVGQALKKFTEVDVIGSDPDNRYKCSKCKQKVQVDKQMTFSQLPPMLNLHLKRFTYDFGLDTMKKIGKHVAFPEVLDMSSFISKDDPQTSNNKNTKYDLYAILVHDGRSCSSGHYYAYVKSPESKWYLMNDQYVMPVSRGEVLRQRAYMLFYKQRGSSSEGEEKTMAQDIKAAQEEEVLKSAVKRKREEAIDEEKEQKQIKKRVHIEDLPIADDPAAWFVQRASDSHHSLRGVLSPATYGAAVSDDSVWAKRDIKDMRKADKNKRYRRRKRLDDRTLNFTIGNLQ